MKGKIKIYQICGFFLLSLFVNSIQAIVVSAAKIPNPKLVFYGTQDSVNGLNQPMKIYWLGIENREEFPEKLFKPAPELPPCGKNANAARSWINIYDDKNKYLYGFCAIKSASELNKISFSLSRNEKPPEYVYVVILDRKDGKKYTSNLLSLKQNGK